MTTDADRFYKAPQGAALFKHKVLKNQLSAFVGMVGRDRKAAFLDGYSGPGAYDDDRPGSPAIAVGVAEDLDAIRAFDGVFIELKPRYANQLRARLTEHGFDHWHVLQGRCDEQLDPALALIADQPLLAFLDPYGLGVPLPRLVADILGRARRPGKPRVPTEVIVNFSDSAINRLGGFLDKDYDRDTIPLFTLDDVDDLAQTEEARIEVRKGKQAAALSLMDDFLGGPWWREVKRQGAATWVHQVRKEWMAKVITQAGPSWQATDVPVRDELGGPIAFHLILITESGAGLWKFNDGVSRAWKDFYESSPWITSADQGLFGTATEDLDSVLNDEMTEHLRNVAATGRSLTVGSDLRDVFGPTVGRAREMHLREAIKRLRAEGALAGAEPVGDLRNYRIVPANGSGISS